MSPSPFTVKTHTIPGQYVREYPGALLHDQEDDLLLHIKQYTPTTKITSPKESVSIVGAHANGFPKELYEPLWEELVRSLKHRNIDVHAIWMADVAHQGQSGLMNQDKLGNDPSWNDHARDMLLMVNHFRKEMPRPIVGIGHSMGANSLVNLSLLHPRLLTALILIDPVIFTEKQSHLLTDTGEKSTPLTLAGLSFARRDTWPSRDEAAAAVKRSPFFKSWDSRVLDRWLRYGLRDLQAAPHPGTQTGPEGGKKGAVVLTTTKDQESFTFLRPTFGRGPGASDPLLYLPDLCPSAQGVPPFYRAESFLTFEQLPRLRPSTFYLFGGLSTVSSPETREERVRRTGIGVGGNGGLAAGKVKQYVLSDGGHLMPMEQVNNVAEVIGEHLADEVESWSREENRWKSWWSSLEKKEKVALTAEWRQAFDEIERVREKL